MPVILSDEQISSLITETKNIPHNYDSLFELKRKKGHREREISIKRPDGSSFKIIMRQNQINVLDFSLILAYEFPKSNQAFRLRRYNGKSHQHTNMIERDIFYDFHIHYATERYQTAGLKEDGYAKASRDYSDIRSAMQRYIADCNVILPDSNQLKLF